MRCQARNCCSMSRCFQKMGHQKLAGRGESSFFGWARCVPGNMPHEQKSIPFFSVHPNDGIAPLFGVKSKGKEIYLDGKKREADNTLDWIVQFIRQDGTCFWRGLNADNSWKDVDLENGKPPKTVIVNNDSSYIYISSDLAIDPNDIPKSLSSIAPGLREQQLLKDYPPREPSERMKKKLQEAAERTKIQAHIQELRKRLKKSKGAHPRVSYAVVRQPPGIPRLLTRRKFGTFWTRGRNGFTEEK